MIDGGAWRGQLSRVEPEREVDEDELDELLKEEDVRREVALALADAVEVDDIELGGWRRDLLSEYEVSEEDARRLRDLVRVMAYAVAETDGERWRLVRKAHEAAFGPLSELLPVADASRLRPQKVHDKSPWAAGHAPELRATAAGAIPAQGDALPFEKGNAAPTPVAEAMQPHPEMGMTKSLDDTASQGAAPEVSVDDLALAPEKYVLAKLEIDKSPADKAAVAQKYGLDVSAWDALHAEYQARGASSPALAARIAGLEKKLGTWVK